MTGWHIPNSKIYLASASQTRIHMLRVAGLVFEAQAASVDEQAIKQAGIAENIAPADIATTLAEVKAGKLASQKEGYVIGCDQLLSCGGDCQTCLYGTGLRTFAKTCRQNPPAFYRGGGVSPWQAHLASLHRSDLAMRRLDQREIADYLDFCGQNALLSPGCYQIEAGGAYLFSDIKGVYYDILGLPLLPLLAFLREHGLSASRPERGMKIIGLTGSIASGKSTIGRMFRQYGMDVHDADKTVHQLLSPSGKATPVVADYFGREVLALMALWTGRLWDEDVCRS